jgi:hypothetical protein
MNSHFSSVGDHQLSTSIRLLSETLSNQHHRRSDRSSSPRHFSDSQVTPVDHHKHNSSLPVTTQPILQTKQSTSSNQEEDDAECVNRQAPPMIGGEPVDRKLSKRGIEAEAEVNRAIDAIIDFNNQENLPHHDKWHIGVGALRKLTQRGDTVAQRVLQQRADQIQQHHAQHQISPRHNSKGKTYPSIHEVISLSTKDATLE